MDGISVTSDFGSKDSYYWIIWVLDPWIGGFFVTSVYGSKGSTYPRDDVTTSRIKY